MEYTLACRGPSEPATPEIAKQGSEGLLRLMGRLHDSLIRTCVLKEDAWSTLSSSNGASFEKTVRSWYSASALFGLRPR